MAFSSPQRLLLLALALVCAVLLSCSKEPPQIKLGSALPPLALTDASGRQVMLSDLTSGRLAAVILWRTGCAFCEREMPLMQPLYLKHKDKGFLIAAIHLGSPVDASAAIAARHALTFPMLTDSRETLKNDFGIRYVPMIFLIDPSGKVVEKILGGVGADALERIIAEKLK